MELTQGVRFDTLELSPEILRALMERNIVQSTPVQAGCIPPMLEWRDVIAKAPTGTGKTMAFGIPIIERIDPDSEDVQAVILAPTRELAMQITDEMRQIAVCHEGVRLVCLYGGQPIGKQINALKRRPQIVVATPGRLSDHMKRRTVSVKEVQTVVLDEADKLSDQVLYFFISLYNQLEGQCGLVLCATNFLEKRITRGVRFNRRGYQEIYSRIGRKFVKLQVVNDEDIAAVCRANGVTSAADIGTIIKDSDNDLRRVKRACWTIKKGGRV